MENSPQNRLERIEKNKDKTDLRRALAFVESHIQQYQANIDRFLADEGYPESKAWADHIEIVNAKDDDTLQITPEETRRLFAHISPNLIQLSKLKTVDYQLQDKLPVPGFDENGNLDFKKIQIVSRKEFPRTGDHPQRALIGYTSPTGEQIYPTTVPPTVSSDLQAVKLYQLHVMLHEFFHTIELPLRTEESASKILLRKGRSFADWKRDYLRSLEQEPLLTSEYSEVYRDRLFDDDGHLKTDVSPYEYGVCEDQAEAFVASHFDIISNPRGYTSFSNESFGNPHPEKQLLTHGNQSLRAGLMQELRKADFITCD